MNQISASNDNAHILSTLDRAHEPDQDRIRQLEAGLTQAEVGRSKMLVLLLLAPVMVASVFALPWGYWVTNGFIIAMIAHFIGGRFGRRKAAQAIQQAAGEPQPP